MGNKNVQLKIYFHYLGFALIIRIVKRIKNGKKE